MNLESLRDSHKVWADHNFPATEPHQPLLGMLEELGELSHAHLKTEQGIRGDYDALYDQKVDAIGDVFMYMLHYCALNGIDITEAIHVAWTEISARDWIKYPTDGKTS